MNYLRKICLLVALACLSSPAAAQVVRNFEPAFSTNDTGDISIVGNSLLTCPSSSPTCTQAQSGNADILLELNNNNAYAMTYVDVDSDGSTFNSSSASYSIPTGANVVWAGLYWGGRTNAGLGGSAAPNPANKDTVKLRGPGATGYSTITAANCDVGLTQGVFDDYQCHAVVTGNIPDSGGSVSVADVQLGTGENRFGGWALVIVYADSSEPLRNLVVYDGFANVLRDTVNPFVVDIPVSGFRTPAQGDVRTRIGSVVYEGDLDAPGESFSLNGTNLSDALNPVDNFFNAGITSLGSLVTARSPSHTNNLGFDIDLVEVTNVLANNATSTTLQLTTTLDTYFPGVITFATEIFAPRVTVSKTVTDQNGGAIRPGDTLIYRFEIENTGNDPADRVVLTDILPAALSYVPGSARIDGVPRTDASDADSYTWSAADREVVAKIGSNPGTIGGSLGTNQLVTLVFEATVNENTEGQEISNQASVSYRARTLGNDFTTLSDSDLGNAGSSPTVVVVSEVDPTIAITSPTDGTSVNDKRPEIRGTANPGATVEVSIDGGTAVEVVANAQGVWSLTPSSDLSEGEHQIEASTENAGQTATDSTSFTVDTVAPNVQITSPIDGSITNETRPTITGQSDPGALVEITIDGGEPATVVADSNGNWSYQPADPLGPGEHDIVAEASDEAGNTGSDSSSFTINPDAFSLNITSPTNGQTVTDATPTITGTTEPGASVEVTFPSGETITVVADTAGNWEATPTQALMDGSNTVSATLPEVPNGPSASVTFTITEANQGLVITSPTPGSVITPEPTITGTAQPGAVIVVVVDGEEIGSTTADADGNWSIPVDESLAPGDTTIVVTATNPDDTVETVEVDVIVNAGMDIEIPDPPFSESITYLSGNGCSQTGGSPMGWLLFLGLLGVLRRRI